MKAPCVARPSGIADRWQSNLMATSNSVQSGVVLWITFPDFLSSGWVAQQESTVLNTIERIYGKALARGWQQVRVSHKGPALVVQGLAPEFVLEVQRALMSRGMEVSLRPARTMVDPVL